MRWKIIFYKLFWIELYYNTKIGIKNYWRYRKIVWKMGDWDFGYMLEMQKFQLELLRKRILNGYEVYESRILKIQDIDRCIELLNNRIEDNYLDKFGGLNSYKYDFIFDPIEHNNEQYYEIREQRTEEEQLEDTQRMHAANDLEKAEWGELWDIIKNGQKADVGAMGWWH